MKSGKIYLNVPFKEKDRAKALGAMWDVREKRWFYIGDDNEAAFSRWKDDNNISLKSISFMEYSDLSEEQKDFIDKVKEGHNVLVDACIGSGKTTAIQVLCNEITGKNILYLTYNTLLKVDAQAKIKKQNVTVTNYHGFAYMCLQRAKIKSGISDLIQTFNRERPELPVNYDLVVLDEYQDIEQEIADMLDYIKEQCPDVQLVAVGDMKQKIYDKTTLDVPDFINKYLDDFITISFTQCFRLNKELADALGWIWCKNIKGVNKECKTETIGIDKVVDFLSVQDPANVLCLGTRAGNMSRVLNTLERLYPKKYNKNTVYASITDEDRSCCKPSADTAIFTTYDSSKGLERKICVVFDYTDSYWYVRNNFPSSNYEILKNIFCVAASRGKERIIFVTSDKGSVIKLNDRDNCLTEPLETKYDYCNPEKPFYVSEMFDFKYKEDVEECYSMLKVKRFHQFDETVLDIPSADGKIDLSPCIGEFIEAKYFKNYDIDAQIKYLRSMPDRPNFYTGMWNQDDITTDHKILLLTALDTCYERYIRQIKPPFVTEEQEQMLFERMQTKLDKNETVQKQGELVLKTVDGNISVVGRCDVMKDDSIYELKFVSEVQHEHFLQLAMYLLMFEKRKGFLWNVKNNEFYEITVPAKIKSEFVNAVVKTITKGHINKCSLKNVS